MIKIAITNRLEITGLPRDLEDFYRHRCVYNTSVYRTDDLENEELNLCENTENGISIPRGLILEVKDLCEKRGLKVEIQNKGFSGEPHNYNILPDINYTSGVYGYQGRCVEEMLKYTTARLQAPAGSGKTTKMCIISALLGKGPLLYLANKERLLKQFRLTAEKVLGIKEEDIGIIKQKKCTIKPLTCGSLQTIGKEGYDLEALKDQFQVVCFDECHLSTALTYRTVLLGLAPERLYGFSATPEHYASEDLNHLMTALLGPIAVTVRDDEIPKRLMPDTFSRLTGCSFYFSANSDAEEWRKRKQRHKLYEAIGDSEPRNELIVTDCLKLLSAGHKLLICVNRVSHGNKLYDILSSHGVKCSFPYKIKTTKNGEEKAQVDHKKLNEEVFEIEKGNINVIIGTYKLFDTGFDCPSLSAVLYAAPFSGDNTTQIIQSAGRIQRFRIEKKHPVVIDYLDDSAPINILKHWGDKRAKFLEKTYKSYDIIR